MRDLAHQLQSAGHVVEVIAGVPGEPSVDGIPVHRLDGTRLRGAGIAVTAAPFRRLRELLAAGAYDVVHVHFGIIAPVAYGATFIAQQLGIPTVATFHSVLRGFDIPLRIVRGAMGVGDWRVRWSAVSSVVAEAMRPLVADAPVCVVPNGIDATWWAPTGQGGGIGERSGPLRACSVMRLHRRKRPALLLEAVARANAARATTTLELFGEGRERRPLERKITRLELRRAVRLPGWVPREGVRRALQHADVFLLPSRLEAFGIAALEARCAGVPVVAMRQSGVRDFLVDGVDSVLVDSDEEFVEQVCRLAADGARLEGLRRGCLESPPPCRWDDVVPRVERLYGEAATV